MRYNATQPNMPMKTPSRMPNGTNVRFDAGTKQRVEKLAKKHGLKKADLVRNALLYKLDEWERNGITFHALNESAA